jgi:hypothetical protein
MTQIAVLNESTKMTDAQVEALTPALGTQWNRDLHTVWRVEMATFTFYPKGVAAPPSDWQLVFLDNSDQAGALAYHDLTQAGLPLSKVFVETIQKAGDPVSVAASHELCEMAVDPWLANAFQDSKGVFWAAEVCDPVEDPQFAYMIDGVLVSDFITPDWFVSGVNWGATSFDFKGHVTKPFEVLAGGYAQYFNPQRGWVEVQGAMLKPYFHRMAARNQRGGQRSAAKR